MLSAAVEQLETAYNLQVAHQMKRQENNGNGGAAVPGGSYSAGIADDTDAGNGADDEGDGADSNGTHDGSSSRRDDGDDGKRWSNHQEQTLFEKINDEVDVSICIELLPPLHQTSARGSRIINGNRLVDDCKRSKLQGRKASQATARVWSTTAIYAIHAVSLTNSTSFLFVFSFNV